MFVFSHEFVFSSFFRMPEIMGVQGSKLELPNDHGFGLFSPVLLKSSKNPVEIIAKVGTDIGKQIPNICPRNLLSPSNWQVRPPGLLNGLTDEFVNGD